MDRVPAADCDSAAAPAGCAAQGSVILRAMVFSVEHCCGARSLRGAGAPSACARRGATFLEHVAVADFSATPRPRATGPLRSRVIVVASASVGRAGRGARRRIREQMLFHASILASICAVSPATSSSKPQRQSATERTGANGKPSAVVAGKTLRDVCGHRRCVACRCFIDRLRELREDVVLAQRLVAMPRRMRASTLLYSMLRRSRAGR